MKNALALTGAGLLLCSAAAAQGADDCANAQVIAGLGPHAFDNTAATKDGPSDCEGIPVRKDVWFRWTPPASGGYVIDTCGTSNVPTRISVYDLQACPVTQAPIACGSKGCSGPNARFSFPTTAGQDVLLRVGSRDVGSSGTGTFTFLYDPCWNTPDDAFEDNDDCESAVALGDGTYPGLKSAKFDPDWFEFDVADGATIVIDTLFTHATGDIDLWLYDACGGASLDVGGSASDNETVSWTNGTGACAKVYLNVLFYVPDTVSECNDYDMIVSGSSAPGSCSGNIGTKYCTPSNANSSGQSAEIWASGSVNVADNDVTLDAIQLAVSQFGMFVNSMSPGSVTPPGSQGVLCLSGGIGRHNASILNSGANGEFSLVLDLTDIPTPGGQVAIQPGETWYWQAWFRDNNPGATSNFTDGVSITFQ